VVIESSMKTPNNVKISKSIIGSKIFKAIAIFARVWKVRRREGRNHLR